MQAVGTTIESRLAVRFPELPISHKSGLASIEFGRMEGKDLKPGSGMVPDSNLIQRTAEGIRSESSANDEWGGRACPYSAHRSDRHAQRSIHIDICIRSVIGGGKVRPPAGGCSKHDVGRLHERST